MDNIEAPMESQPLSANAPVPAAARPVRVWLVDDNEELRMLMADILGRLEGIECSRHFSSPDEVLSALASKPGPDVILLDVQMGERNGLDAVRPIKSLTRTTRVMMFTTCYNRDWRTRALDEGASDYLLKTDTMERVASRIRNPAEDPAPRQVFRRRRVCPPASAVRQTTSVMDSAPRLVSRTLKMFRIFSN